MEKEKEKKMKEVSGNGKGVGAEMGKKWDVCMEIDFEMMNR